MLSIVVRFVYQMRSVWRDSRMVTTRAAAPWAVMPFGAPRIAPGAVAPSGATRVASPGARGSDIN